MRIAWLYHIQQEMQNLLHESYFNAEKTKQLARRSHSGWVC